MNFCMTVLYGYFHDSLGSTRATGSYVTDVIIKIWTWGPWRLLSPWQVCPRMWHNASHCNSKHRKRLGWPQQTFTLAPLKNKKMFWIPAVGLTSILTKTFIWPRPALACSWFVSLILSQTTDTTQEKPFKLKNKDTLNRIQLFRFHLFPSACRDFQA